MAFNFLDNLDKASSKVKHQRFSVSLGIETFDVLIPFTDATLFENDVESSKPSKRTQLESIVKRYNGKIEIK